jgi:hypothetical protein
MLCVRGDLPWSPLKGWLSTKAFERSWFLELCMLLSEDPAPKRFPSLRRRWLKRGALHANVFQVRATQVFFRQM